MNGSSILKAAIAFALGLVVVMFAYVTLIRPFWEASRGGTTVMRSYIVHGDHADEVRAALQSALRSGDDDRKLLGRVTLAPNGQLIVTAPDSIQRGVAKLLDDVLAVSPGPTPTIKLEAWFVRGSNEGESDPRLGEVEPALAAVREAQGVTQFQLIEKLTLHSRAGHGGHIEGERSQLNAQPSVRRAGRQEPVVSSQLNLEVRGGSRLSAEVELTPGELLVLGESAYAEGDPLAAPPQTLYYIVRATL